MSAASTRVCIVGAGLAGLACALAVARTGAQTELFDAAPAASEIQAHVDVVPNMMRELVRLGVADAVVRAGFPYRRTSFVAQDGRSLFAIDAQRLAGERYPAALGISRHSLHQVLVDACEIAGVKFHWGVRVAGVDRLPQGVLVHLDSGSLTADLAVLACGAHSALRESVFAPPPESEIVAWTYLVAARPPAIDEAIFAVGARGPKAHAVPIGARHLGLSLNTSGASLPEGGMHKLLSALAGPLAQLASLPHSNPVQRRIPVGMLQPARDAARVIAVGECACALPPHFGQSAAQAFEDAIVLAELLPHLGAHHVAQAFQARRAPRQREVLEITRRAARWDAAPEPKTDFRLLADSLGALLARPA